MIETVKLTPEITTEFLSDPTLPSDARKLIERVRDRFSDAETPLPAFATFSFIELMRYVQENDLKEIEKMTLQMALLTFFQKVLGEEQAEKVNNFWHR